MILTMEAGRANRLALALWLASCLSAAQAQEMKGPGSGSGSEGDDGLENRAGLIALAIAGLLCLASLVIAVSGIAVAYQYPQPHCLCWHTGYSDLAGGKGCCSLYRSNMGMALLWALFLVIMAITRNLLRMAVCLGFTLMHCAAAYLLRKAFMLHGFPAWAEGTAVTPVHTDGSDDQLGAPALIQLMARPGPGNFPHAEPLPATGLPVYRIPLLRAEVGTPGKGDDECSCPTCLKFQQADAAEAAAAAGWAAAAAAADSYGAGPSHAPRASSSVVLTIPLRASGDSLQPGGAGHQPGSPGAPPPPPWPGQQPPVLAHPVPQNLLLVAGASVVSPEGTVLTVRTVGSRGTRGTTTTTRLEPQEAGRAAGGGSGPSRASGSGGVPPGVSRRGSRDDFDPQQAVDEYLVRQRQRRAREQRINSLSQRPPQ